MRSERPTLCRADLEVFDATPQGSGCEKRFRCPFCRDSERAFHVNMETGAFNCKRASCGVKGQLSDFWKLPKETRMPVSRSDRARTSLTRAFGGELRAPSTSAIPLTFGLPTSEPLEVKVPVKTGNWQNLWENALSLDEPRAQRGADYLCERGITIEVARAAGVRFCPDWAPHDEGKIYRAGPAVLFPSVNECNEVVAVNGRYLKPRTSGDAKPLKTRTGGTAKIGVFLTPARIGAEWVSPFDRRLDAVILVEGQVDALSLAMCGFPALAAGGVNLAPWLHRRLGLRSVFIGIDADAGGDKNAPQWEAYLSNYGAKCTRFKPENAKDWNEMLVGARDNGTKGMGRVALTDWLVWRHSNLLGLIR